VAIALLGASVLTIALVAQMTVEFARARAWCADNVTLAVMSKWQTFASPFALMSIAATVCRKLLGRFRCFAKLCRKLAKEEESGVA
jgi:hypothetical protein